MFDLGPAADDMARLVRGVRDDQLDDATPCADWTVAALLQHIDVFTTMFTANARKQPAVPPDHLGEDWPTGLPERLGELARAWREPSAWQGRVAAGGVEMDAGDNAVVAVEELTVHGWDLARATGQDLEVGDDRLDEVEPFFELFGTAPFGPKRYRPDTSTGTALSRLDELIARTGRDPRWRAGQPTG